REAAARGGDRDDGAGERGRAAGPSTSSGGHGQGHGDGAGVRGGPAGDRAHRGARTGEGAPCRAVACARACADREAGARRLPRPPRRLAARRARPRAQAGARRAVMRAAIAIALFAACSARDLVASEQGSADGGVAAYCLGSGPPVLVGDGITNGDGDGAPDNVCSGTIAVRTFVRALCTCEGYATSTRLTTDSFDSAAGPYTPGGTAAPVGID